MLKFYITFILFTCDKLLLTLKTNKKDNKTFETNNSEELLQSNSIVCTRNRKQKYIKKKILIMLN